MSEFLSAAYPWVKTLHVVAVIAWMAAMLYLPRLFVYHADAAQGSELSETFKVMERRLMAVIMTPSMIAAWLFGLALAATPGVPLTGWFHAKLALVLGLSGLHGYLSVCRKAFAADRNTRSARFYRILNEVPALVILAAVTLVIVKPF